MHIRLTEADRERLLVAQRHFATLDPVPVHLGNVDIVRVALRELAEKIAGPTSTSDHRDGVDDPDNLMPVRVAA